MDKVDYIHRAVKNSHKGHYITLCWHEREKDESGLEAAVKGHTHYENNMCQIKTNVKIKNNLQLVSFQLVRGVTCH